MTEGRAEVVGRYGVRTLSAIEDFVRHASEAARVSAKRQRFDPNEADLMAEALIVRLGEAVRRMSDQFVADHPNLMLRPILDTRNAAAHGYGIVDHQLLWNAIDHRLPQIREALNQLLALS